METLHRTGFATLEARASALPRAEAVRFDLGGGASPEPWTFAAWREASLAAAGGLARLGVGPGDRVAIVLPSGPAFLATFFGAWALGAVPVPLYPPARAQGLERYQQQLEALLAAADPRAVVTFKQVAVPVAAAASRLASAPAFALDTELAGPPPKEAPGLAGGPDETALVQFSSGSTARPKGVVLTHRMLWANVEAVLARVAPGPADRNCSWLPLYHDMGLIGGLLMPLASGNPLTLLSPQRFLLDPAAWLRAISRDGGTVSAAPNFAYQFVADRLDPRQLEGLDLSGWRIALNGAEPAKAETMAAFSRLLAPTGFRPEAFTPVYGLAEVALCATFPPAGRGVRCETVDAGALRDSGEAVPLEGGQPFVSLGGALDGYAVAIRDEATLAELPERRVGRIALRGPSVMAGYRGDPERTAEALLPDGWLLTGDRGYLAGGELYYVSRASDAIIRAGRNYAPQDLEAAALGVKGVRPGGAMAFGAPGGEGTEAVVVLVETRLPESEHPALTEAVALAVLGAVGLRPDVVRAVPAGALPKTTSGKPQRTLARAWYGEGRPFLTPTAPSWRVKAHWLWRATGYRLSR